MLLIFHTLIPQQITLVVAHKGHIQHELTKTLNRGVSENVLHTLKELLEEQSIVLASIKGIVVTLGPGSFSAVRIGVVITNTLAWALEIPLFGYKAKEFKDMADLAKKAEQQYTQQIVRTNFRTSSRKFQPLVPWYGKEPNITTPKNIQYKIH